MALWGNNDNINSTGLVWLNYATGVVTATGSSFGSTGGGGHIQEGDVIRFGTRNIDGENGVFFGDAVVKSIQSTTQLTIASTAGLSGAAIAGTDFYASQLPKYTIGDPHYRTAGGSYDSFVYGLSTSQYNPTTNVNKAYTTSGEGWVGVTTYIDTGGNLRVKSETLVAMSGITTGTTYSILYPSEQ